MASPLVLTRPQILAFRRRAGALDARLPWGPGSLRQAAWAGLLGGRSVHEAALEFHALCEGLAAVESRGMLPRGDAERLWREALGALVRGFAEPGPRRRQRKGTVTGPGTRR